MILDMIYHHCHHGIMVLELSNMHIIYQIRIMLSNSKVVHSVHVTAAVTSRDVHYNIELWTVKVNFKLQQVAVHLSLDTVRSQLFRKFRDCIRERVRLSYEFEVQTFQKIQTLLRHFKY